MDTGNKNLIDNGSPSGRACVVYLRRDAEISNKSDKNELPREEKSKYSLRSSSMIAKPPYLDLKFPSKNKVSKLSPMIEKYSITNSGSDTKLIIRKEYVTSNKLIMSPKAVKNSPIRTTFSPAKENILSTESMENENDSVKQKTNFQGCFPSGNNEKEDDKYNELSDNGYPKQEINMQDALTKYEKCYLTPNRVISNLSTIHYDRTGAHDPLNLGVERDPLSIINSYKLPFNAFERKHIFPSSRGSQRAHSRIFRVRRPRGAPRGRRSRVRRPRGTFSRLFSRQGSAVNYSQEARNNRLEKNEHTRHLLHVLFDLPTDCVDTILEYCGYKTYETMLVIKHLQSGEPTTLENSYNLVKHHLEFCCRAPSMCDCWFGASETKKNIQKFNEPDVNFKVCETAPDQKVVSNESACNNQLIDIQNEDASDEQEKIEEQFSIPNELAYSANLCLDNPYNEDDTFGSVFRQSLEVLWGPYE